MSKSGSSAGGLSGAGRKGRSQAIGERGDRQAKSGRQHAAERKSGQPTGAAERFARGQVAKKPGAKLKPLSKADSKAVAKAKTAKKPTKAQRELQLAASVRKTVAKNNRRAARG